MTNNDTAVLRFDHVSFAYNEGKKVIMDDVSFSVRRNTKISIMGQNGAGKSTLFKLILWELKPSSGKINLEPNTKIAIARQVIPRNQLDLTVREYFATAFKEKDYQLDMKIGKVLDEMRLHAPLEKGLKDFSGGQQARLLLAHALIQDPDILLLDEPTNNLDAAGIGDLIGFLMSYEKTVLVISHDADFLNMFTDGVLYLNVMRHQVEQYWWDYYDVVEQIKTQIEKEQKQNARMEKKIKDAKEKINFFSNKWGKMRKIAKKMRAEVEEAEENKVEVRRDDATIKKFTIPFDNFVEDMIVIKNISLMHPTLHEVQDFPFSLVVRKKQKYLLTWPNGIWKSTLLKRLVHAHDKDAFLASGVRVGYYSQDFSELDMNMVVRDALHEVTNEATDQEVYRAAAGFLLKWELLKTTIGMLSEGQKGLLCYARFVLQKPHLLILDEPTNHINFRHLPVISEALNQYEWGMIVVSHDEGFLADMQWLEPKDLGQLVA